MQLDLDEKLKEYVLVKINSDIEDNETLKRNIDEEERLELENLKEKYRKKRESADNEYQQLNGFISRNKLRKCEKCKKYSFQSDFVTRKEIKQEWDCVYKDIINSGGNQYRMSDKEYTYQTCPACMKEHLLKVEVQRHFGETVGKDRVR